MFLYNIKRKLHDFLCRWLSIYDIRHLNNKTQMELDHLRQILKERTSYNLDVHQYAGSQVIITGKYHSKDFVHCYSIEDKSINDIINHCRNLEKYAHRGKIDAWPTVNACINNELSVLGY